MIQWVQASAPGKFVILGEHAVVYGKPAIVLAISRRFGMKIRKSDIFRINGEPADLRFNPHMAHILKAHGSFPVNVYLNSSIPAGSGLGSSAALSVAFSAAVRKLEGDRFDECEIAKEAFEAEFAAQGRGSPMDTSASAHGKGITLNIPGKEEDHLWDISKNGNNWNISDIDVPTMSFVIGYTGIRAPTGPLVEKVKKYRERNRFASDIVDEIGTVTLEGAERLKKNDKVGLGELMTYDHKLLSILGVSCNELNKLVEASLPYSYGAKLTGSGGGGSMVALTDRPEEVSKAILAHGGVPIVVSTGVDGVTVNIREQQ